MRQINKYYYPFLHMGVLRVSPYRPNTDKAVKLGEGWINVFANYHVWPYTRALYTFILKNFILD